MNNNWYIQAKMQKEAGIKENISFALLSAVMAVMGGSAIWQAAQKFNIQPEAIEAGLENPETIRAIEQLKFDQDPLPTNTENKQTNTNDKQTEIQKNIIARTIYAEGLSEGRKGMEAIASVIFNRSDGTPQDMVAEIQVDWQFSCWNAADASDWTNMKQGKGNAWKVASEIADSMVNGSFVPLGEWDHYYNPKLADPGWAYVDPKHKTTLRPHTKIGNHSFIKM